MDRVRPIRVLILKGIPCESIASYMAVQSCSCLDIPAQFTGHRDVCIFSDIIRYLEGSNIKFQPWLCMIYYSVMQLLIIVNAIFQCHGYNSLAADHGGIHNIERLRSLQCVTSRI